MALKLTWDDKNLDVDGFRIYRSDTFIQPYALPPPLTTVGPGIFEYVDETAVRNKPYHYRVGSFKGTEESVSQDRILCNMPYTGPGPQQLLRGTWESGFFGEVLTKDLFNNIDLINGLSISNSGVLPDTNWLKFVYKGKILFFPIKGIAYVSKANLYKAGVVYGNEDQSNWATYLTTTYGVVPQSKILQKDQDIFLVRLPKSRDNLGDTDFASITTGEWDNCIAKAYFYHYYDTPTKPVIGKTGDYVHMTAIGWYEVISAMDSYGDKSDKFGLVRGSSVSDAWWIDNIARILVESVLDNNHHVNWMPILELVF